MHEALLLRRTEASWNRSREAGGQIRGILVREQQAIDGTVELNAVQLGEGLFRVTLRIANCTSFEEPGSRSRDEALLCSLVSAHAILGVAGGEFISLLDPPDCWRDAAAACRNIGCWPVMVGAEGQTDTMLSSPIILYDYPQIAPESPGSFFDGTEIDEMLTLRIMTLTDEEKQSMAAVDERAAQPPGADRVDGQRANARPSWHVSAGGAGRRGRQTMSDLDPEADRRKVECVHVGAAEIRAGDRVRLQPRGRADIMDMALAGKTATVDSIEQDFEQRVYLAVTVDDDPGKDLGSLRQPGHRFFFSPEEVEPLG